MSGKANKKRRKRVSTGRKRAAPEQEPVRRKKVIEEKEFAATVEALETRSRIAEPSTVLISNDGMEILEEPRSK
jgi:hypothetical protein